MLWAQESLLSGFRGPYGVVGIKSGLGACEANTLLTVLWLQPGLRKVFRRMSIFAQISFGLEEPSLPQFWA